MSKIKVEFISDSWLRAQWGSNFAVQFLALFSGLAFKRIADIEITMVFQVLTSDICLEGGNMFVIIGTITADWIISSKPLLSNLSGDGFTADNLVFCDESPQMLLGGNGGCSAYVLAGLGMPTALCSAVGRDHIGKRVVGWLEARNVNLKTIYYSETHATSTSTVIMSDAAHQTVFHHLGATRDIDPIRIPQKLINDTDVLLATSYSLIPRMRSGGLQIALTAVRQAGGLCAVDIGPAIGKPVRLTELQPLLPNIDFFIANTHELSVLTQSADWEASSRRLIAAGAKCIVIKRGAHGASVRSPDLELDVPGFKVESHISVGAGDAFNVGFLKCVQQGRSYKQAIQFANGLAALIVSGAKGILDAPTEAQVDSFIAKEIGAAFQESNEKR